MTTACRIVVAVITLSAAAWAQQPPYDVFPPADPPYYRVRYEASTQPGGLVFPVNYTIWIPHGVKSLRGVIVHQHGCGEGSCKSGLTGAFDLHWQALAKKHDCALLAPAYEQPEKADCQMWCDPLRDMPTDSAWLAEPTGSEAVPAPKYAGSPLKAAWLPSEPIARAWMQYVKDTRACSLQHSMASLSVPWPVRIITAVHERCSRIQASTFSPSTFGIRKSSTTTVGLKS